MHNFQLSLTDSFHKILFSVDRIFLFLFLKCVSFVTDFCDWSYRMLKEYFIIMFHLPYTTSFYLFKVKFGVIFFVGICKNNNGQIVKRLLSIYRPVKTNERLNALTDILLTSVNVKNYMLTTVNVNLSLAKEKFNRRLRIRS